MKIYNKLLNFSKSILWLLGVSVLIAQSFRLVMFYLASWNFEINLSRDIFSCVLGVTFMFLQSPLKSFSKNVLNNALSFVKKK